MACTPFDSLLPAEKTYLIAQIRALQVRIALLESNSPGAGGDAFVSAARSGDSIQFTRAQGGTAIVPIGQLHVGTLPPTNVSETPLWLNTLDEQFYVYDGAAWVSSAPSAAITALDAALTAHIANHSNPHGVTVSQIGAAAQIDLAAHTLDYSNPHNVTAAQLGASVPADFAAVAFSGDFNDLINTPPPGSSISDFIDLLDVPGAYTGSAGKAVAVNSTASGLEFISFPVGGILDAPSDGKLYGRQDGVWVEITVPSGGSGDCAGRWGEVVLCPAA